MAIAHGLMLLALLTLLAGVAFALLHFRAEAKRDQETLRATSFVEPTRLPLPVAKLERDQRLAFGGKVRQQIRVVDLTAGGKRQAIRVVKPTELS